MNLNVAFWNNSKANVLILMAWMVAIYSFICLQSSTETRENDSAC